MKSPLCSIATLQHLKVKLLLGSNHRYVYLALENLTTNAASTTARVINQHFSKLEHEVQTNFVEPLL